MKDLIEALTIFLKYGNPRKPTHCEHDVLYILVDPVVVSDADKARLDQLGFFPSEDVSGAFASFRFGSA